MWSICVTCVPVDVGGSMEEENLNDRHGNDDLLLPQLHTDTTRTVCARAAPYKMHTASTVCVCGAV